ncbi:MAG: hypothetical protein ACRDOH_17435 [Streptosporangiaceae bacterium]
MRSTAVADARRPAHALREASAGGRTETVITSATPPDAVVLHSATDSVVGHDAGQQHDAAAAQLPGEEVTQLSGAAVQDVRADGLAVAAIGRERSGP